MVDEYRLPPEDLKAWALRAVRLRAKIKERTEHHAEPAPENEAVVPSSRSRLGHKRSKPADNEDGLQEKELRK